jgi:hypothetical protein
MNFIEAMQALQWGEKIRRKSWEDKNYFLSKDHTGMYQFSKQDLDSTEWEIYKEPIPLELDEMIYFVWDDLKFDCNSQSRFYDRTRIKSYDELLQITLNYCLYNDPTINKELMEFIRDRYNKNK